MTGAESTPPPGVDLWKERLSYLVGGAAFLRMRWEPTVTLGRNWSNEPEHHKTDG